MSTITQPLKWHGGKHYLAKRIIELMPPHVHYVEPYFGGGSVLLQKDPEGVSEVVNDLNYDLSRFWCVLKHELYFEKFRRLVEAVPFSQWEFETAEPPDEFAKQVMALVEDDDEGRDARMVYDAVKFFVRMRQSRQGLGKDFATLSRNRTRRGMNEQVSSWLTAVEGLPEVHARLKRVVILNDDAVKVIKQQDGENTLFYLDPPYLHETRASTGEYEHEMTVADHMRLLGALSGIKGKFILSGYPSQLYANWQKEFGFHRVDIEIDNKASSAKSKEKKTECLWMNY